MERMQNGGLTIRRTPHKHRAFWLALFFKQSSLTQTQIMEYLKKMNAEVEACLNMTVSSAASMQIVFPQSDVKEHLNALLTAAKQLELYLVKRSHQLHYPPNLSQLDILRNEVSDLRIQEQRKEEAISSVQSLVKEWTEKFEDLQNKQTKLLFDVVEASAEPIDPFPGASSMTPLDENSKMSTDENFWVGLPSGGTPAAEEFDV